MRIVFAGTPEFAEFQLRALLDAKFNIVAVYTQPDRPAGRGQHLHPSPVKILAQAHGLPVENTLETLSNYQPDVMIVAAYGVLLPASVLQIPRFGCINVHASLLPRWRGASPIQQAILAGDAQTGVTLMRMDAGLDTGNILATANMAISPTETAESLQKALAVLGAKCLVEKLEQIVKLPGTPQDAAFATHAPKINKAQAHIHWQLPAHVIERQIRAFNPWPIATTSINQQLLRIWQAEIVSLSSVYKPGTIVDQTPRGIIVATGEQGLLITAAQLPGKKCMAFADILKSRATLFAPLQCLS